MDPEPNHLPNGTKSSSFASVYVRRWTRKKRKFISARLSPKTETTKNENKKYSICTYRFSRSPRSNMPLSTTTFSIYLFQFIRPVLRRIVGEIRVARIPRNMFTLYSHISSIYRTNAFANRHTGYTVRFGPFQLQSALHKSAARQKNILEMNVINQWHMEIFPMQNTMSTIFSLPLPPSLPPFRSVSSVIFWFDGECELSQLIRHDKSSCSYVHT